MPRRRAIGTGGIVFHVLNRGVRRLRLFDAPGDYQAFLNVMAEAQARTPIRCLAYCLMPSHFHMVLWPATDDELSGFMGWMTGTHSMRWHAWRRTLGTGHVYQGRYRAFPVSTDIHFYNVCRYVERNPVRAGLVDQPGDWPWSSLAQRAGRRCGVLLSDWPIARPPDWDYLVGAEVPEETSECRQAVGKSAPLGPDDWKAQIAAQLGLDRSLRRRGRPSKP